MIRAALVLVLACAGAAGAATWTCPKRTNLAPSIVIASCQATGTYTTGGDTLGGGGDNTELCNSENRFPVSVLPSLAASKVTGEGYGVLVLAATPPARIVLVTAAQVPGSGVALTQLGNGSDIDGATFTTLVTCK